MLNSAQVTHQESCVPSAQATPHCDHHTDKMWDGKLGNWPFGDTEWQVPQVGDPKRKNKNVNAEVHLNLVRDLVVTISEEWPWTQWNDPDSLLRSNGAAQGPREWSLTANLVCDAWRSHTEGSASPRWQDQGDDPATQLSGLQSQRSWVVCHFGVRCADKLAKEFSSVD